MILMAPYVEREATKSWRSFFRSADGSSLRMEASMAGTPAKFEYVSMLARNEGKLFRSSRNYCVSRMGDCEVRQCIVSCTISHQWGPLII